MNAAIFASRSARSGKLATASRLRRMIENHCSTWFIHEQWTGVKCIWKRGCRASHARTSLPLCVITLSQTRWMAVMCGGGSAPDPLDQLDEFELALAPAADADDLAGPGVEGGEQVERSPARVLVLQVDRNEGG